MPIAFAMRQASEADIAALCAMDHIAAHEPCRRAFIARAVNEGDCIVCETEDGLVGYAVLAYTFFELGFVSMLYVHADHRRQGVGAALLRDLETRCTTPKLFTSTNLSNLPMQKLVNRLGYVLAGVVHHLDECDPELFYVRYLDPNAADNDDESG